MEKRIQKFRFTFFIENSQSRWMQQNKSNALNNRFLFFFLNLRISQAGNIWIKYRPGNLWWVRSLKTTLHYIYASSLVSIECIRTYATTAHFRSFTPSVKALVFFPRWCTSRLTPFVIYCWSSCTFDTFALAVKTNKIKLGIGIFLNSADNDADYQKMMKIWSKNAF